MSHGQWLVKDCNRAVLFAPQQGEATIKSLSEKATAAAVMAAYVIQNERFNYFDGIRGGVYDIADAKFYDTAEEAEKRTRSMT